MRKQKTNNYGTDKQKQYDRRRGVEVLGIEPLEVMEYGNVVSPIVELLTKRYDEQLFTVMTTNLTPDSIRKRYGDRIADRLNEMAIVIPFKNATYRTDSASLAE